MLVSLAGARQACGLRAVVGAVAYAQTPCPRARFRRREGHTDRAFALGGQVCRARSRRDCESPEVEIAMLFRATVSLLVRVNVLAGLVVPSTRAA